jgi:hypothetical protein
VSPTPGQRNGPPPLSRPPLRAGGPHAGRRLAATCRAWRTQSAAPRCSAPNPAHIISTPNLSTSSRTRRSNIFTISNNRVRIATLLPHFVAFLHARCHQSSREGNKRPKGNPQKKSLRKGERFSRAPLLFTPRFHRDWQAACRSLLSHCSSLRSSEVLSRRHGYRIRGLALVWFCIPPCPCPSRSSIP